jgi:predicted transcriptional regulator
LSSGISKLKELLQKDGPMTSHELQELGISRAVISRAVEAGEVLDEASVREVTGQGRRSVILYYLYPDQLETRKDRVYVPLSSLEEREQEAIDRYIESIELEGWICMGNIERDLGLDLSGPSETCRRRRDYVLKAARNKGIQLRQGVDEDRPTTGGRLWWLRHAEDAHKQLDELRSNLPIIEHDAKYDVLRRRHRSTGLTLRHESDQFGVLESILKKPILEHLGAPILSKLREIFASMKRTGSFDSMGFLRDDRPTDVQGLCEDMRQVIEKVGALEQEWVDSGLTGDCEKCRSVLPKPSSFVKPQF